MQNGGIKSWDRIKTGNLLWYLPLEEPEDFSIFFSRKGISLCWPPKDLNKISQL